MGNCFSKKEEENSKQKEEKNMSSILTSSLLEDKTSLRCISLTSTDISPEQQPEHPRPEFMHYSRVVTNNENRDLCTVLMTKPRFPYGKQIIYARIMISSSFGNLSKKAVIEFNFFNRDTTYELSGYLGYLNGSITDVKFYHMLVSKHGTNPVLMELILEVMRSEPSKMVYK